jgi:hypothetical protein
VTIAAPARGVAPPSGAPATTAGDPAAAAPNSGTGARSAARRCAATVAPVPTKSSGMFRPAPTQLLPVAVPSPMRRVKSRNACQRSGSQPTGTNARADK